MCTTGLVVSICAGGMLYDAANQLIRENLYYGSGSSANKTVTYEYDQWGNIQRKLEYVYTTASELAEPIANVVLSFNGNSPTNGVTVLNLPSNISAAPGTTVTIPNVTPQLNSHPLTHRFASWNTKADGTGTTYYPGQSITLNSNVTLYAKWTMGAFPPGGGGIRGEAPEKPEEPERAVAPYPVKAYIYNYADSNWKDKLTSIETYTVNASGYMWQATVTNLTYDSMGNPTSYRGNTLAWEGKQLSSYSRMIGSQTITYTYRYNEDGLRTQKIGSINGTIGETTNYYYNGSVLIGMQKGNIVQRFSYDAQGKVVAVDYSENGGSSYTTYYYLRNAQGDIVKLIDNGGGTQVEYTYDSWGKLLSTTGDHASGVGSNQPFRYRGYVYDGETQWYYLQSRYYDPNTCRFISSDVLLSTGQGVIGHNSYAYCLNNPVMRMDTCGCASIFAIIEWIIGILSPLEYDVPLYNQGNHSLCWAFSQTMVESYQSGVVLSQEMAEARAIEIAISVYGDENWDKGGWPTNVLPDGAADVEINSILDLYCLLKIHGPVYSLYWETVDDPTSSHIVVVTGVNILKNEVYTNNPWGHKGKQSYSEFKNGYLGSTTKQQIQYCLFPIKPKGGRSGNAGIITYTWNMLTK